MIMLRYDTNNLLVRQSAPQPQLSDGFDTEDGLNKQQAEDFSKMLQSLPI